MTATAVTEQNWTALTLEERCAWMRQQQESKRLREKEQKNLLTRQERRRITEEDKAAMFAGIDDETRGMALSLAKHGCRHCMGLGSVQHGRGGTKRRVCSCVYRAAFRKVLGKCKAVLSNPYGSSKCRMERTSSGALVRGFKDVEFMADVHLLAKRSLSPTALYIFEWHLVAGFQWHQVCGKVGLDRGNFFHEVYRIENTLGRLFVELKPHPLFPIGRYYGGHRVYVSQFAKGRSRKVMYGGEM